MNTMVQPQAISLRIAEEADIDALCRMAGKLFWEAFTGMMPEQDLLEYVEKAFTPEIFQKEMNNPHITFIIATCNNEWAGYAKLNTTNRKERAEVIRYIELERLYLFKSFHGKKIGAALMDHSITLAAEKGYNTLWLNVWEQNHKAIQFYLSYGFEMMDTSIMMRGNDAQKALWMKKPLF
ncbi:GNAT family N-acetyltransferase [Pseudoflavitalea sp. G-6-1-2]|uniref:GNAT family N-acetyltransferase n=1 Tax=Pseudoflavitalea sp. G-6-1-2 TaxID=2728841 RepID=UPI00146BD355|nr:GNAT family N-acetyltransferase [Pseudoflavitalea sp. G-6-1-2]NML20839.1 GNAT family N-acetyltransferase [Pseudoflavitalea sp. G-6-1-2]